MKGFARTATWIAGILGAICLLLYLFVFDTWVIPNDDAALMASVLPNLFANDRILVYRGREPKLGQLARCASPDPTKPYVIGRVFGLSGDLVEIKRERVFTNGKSIPNRHGCPPMTYYHPVSGQPVTLTCGVEETGAWSYSFLLNNEFPEGERRSVVEPGKVYLVSDNRHTHKDSRDFGQLDASTCEHVVFRLWGESFTDSSRRFSVLW
jgi:signal peptidase I